MVHQMDDRPPAEMSYYHELIAALRALVSRAGISQRELVRRSPTLARSTVGAVLRQDRSSRLRDVVAIVRACGVSEDAVTAWADESYRLGVPYRAEADYRRRVGAYVSVHGHAPRTHPSTWRRTSWRSQW